MQWLSWPFSKGQGEKAINSAGYGPNQTYMDSSAPPHDSITTRLGFWPAKNLPNPVLLGRSRFSIRPVSPATAISKTSFARSTLRVTERSTLVVDTVDVLLERGPVDPMPPDYGTTKTYEVSLAPGKTIQFDVE